ncbi:hypothetical protein GOP47_0008894 [Adiantum capillus-veneris]|uniref:Uncharacterized protein n=1 Tax=Adiantum capillus-veneris TaxID=13818 RepID=A0A9D4UXL2_ADICA|nr:hypothetical protein GOP47_0008100 [Adiantum capillus-veneris]KAI5076829.1 hypothetical protein GOP47_0008894 [Adiantum capillus-veneris]
MFRDVNGEGDPLSKQQAPTSSYLVYLLLLSAGLIVVLPYMFPSRGLLSRTGSAGSDEIIGSSKSSGGRIRTRTRTMSSPVYDYSLSHNLHKYESKCESLEILVMDLQRVVHVERERTMHLENEIRVMQISESFLKERVQYLEDRNWDFRRESSSSSSMDSLLRSAQFAAPSEARKTTSGVPDTLIHDLLRMVHVERERTMSLESEIRLLQKAEMSLQSRIQMLEEQFASTCKKDTTSKDGKQ